MINDRKILEAALRGICLQGIQVQEKIDQVKRLIRATEEPQIIVDFTGHKRTISPKARARMAAAQRRRWRAVRNQQRA